MSWVTAFFMTLSWRPSWSCVYLSQSSVFYLNLTIFISQLLEKIRFERSSLRPSPQQPTHRQNLELGIHAQPFQRIPPNFTMARKKSREKGDSDTANYKDKTVSKHIQPLTDFHIFPKLPIELRLMIIEEALYEDEKDRPARIVLFDNNTYRISPLVEQSKDLSPMLFVNKLFRKVALMIYVMLQVIEVGVPFMGEFGDEDDFLNDDGELEYNLDIARLIDREADGEGRFYEGLKVCSQSRNRYTSAPHQPCLAHLIFIEGNGLLLRRSFRLSRINLQGHVYIRPEIDIFLTGLVPRQICNTEMFSFLLDAGPDESWSAPMCQ